MKKIIFSCLLSLFAFLIADAQYRTARTGYEGDYFSLEGALELFKQSRTLMDFERRLNTQENWVNNLDLNYDGRIDYIRVEHRRQGNYHAIILQALLGRYEVQDVAVIGIEIIGPREAVLQIIGAEDLYGEEVIVEPVDGYHDSRRGYHSNYGGYVNVYHWPPVQYILGRQYRVYTSPYRWEYYPAWWSPWVQFTWSVFHPRIVIYHRHYLIVPRRRVIHVYNFYNTYRSYSYNVVLRTNEVRIKHGKPPIHRAAPVGRQYGRSFDNPERANVTERSSVTPRSNTPEQHSSVSRERTPSAVEPRTSAGSTTPARTPSAIGRTTPTAQPDANRSAPASARPQTRETPAQPGATTTRPRTSAGSTNPARTPSAIGRTAPTAQPDVSRRAPVSAHPQARGTTTQPGATTRARSTAGSTPPARTPSASSGRSAPVSTPKATSNATSNGSRSTSAPSNRDGGE
jgi:hypothetical protein